MLSVLISIIGIIITILFVIGTHEAAHFYMARLMGVKVLRFSIGFGKAIFRFRDKQQTEYVFAWIPLGGYVQMLDENEGEVPTVDLPKAYNRQPYYKKFLIVLAGPLANLFCALMLYWLIFMIGFTTVKPVTGTITSNSIAALSGLKSNQEIIKIDNKLTPTWTSVVVRIITHAGNQDQMQMTVKPYAKANDITTHILDLKTWELSGLTPDPLSSLGISPYMPPMLLIIGYISEDSPAAHAKLAIGDKLIALNGKPIKDWETLVKQIDGMPQQHIVLTIERAKQRMEVPLTTGSRTDFLTFKAHGYIGIAPNVKIPPDMLHKIQYGPIQAIQHAAFQIYDFTYFNFLLFGKLITGKLSLQSLGGPISIFESAGEALNYGFISFIAFLAFLSVAIGVINLLPIPGLDGGHLALQTVEAIIRRPVPEKILTFLYRLGFFILLFVLFQALINDILRLF